MKKLASIAFATLLSAGFAFAQNITVQGEKKLNTDFKKYKTFGWVSTDKPGNQLIEYTYEEWADPATMTAENRADRKADMKSDKGMKKDGTLKMHGKKNKDIVVYSYSFIVPAPDSTINNAAINAAEDELEGRGYRKDMMNPDFLVAYKIFDRKTQIKGYDAAPTEVASGNEVHQPQDTITYALRPGTVLISLIDAKTSEVIWEGYASGVAKKDDIINDRMRVKEAVNLIFKKFEFRGDKYSMN